MTKTQTIGTINNKINFNKSKLICIPDINGNTDLNVVVALMAELAQYGYTLSGELISKLQTVHTDVVRETYDFLTNEVKKSVGADVQHKSLFGNFPLDIDQDLQHYLNRISYFATSLGLNFTYDAGTDTELDYTSNLKVIGLASETKAFELFGNICSSVVSVSDTDKDFVREFIKVHSISCVKYVPSEVSSKENMAVVIVALLQNTKIKKPFLAKFLKTATDILRVACELSGGDCTLKEKTKFKMKNSERKFIMEALNVLPNPQEDMLRHKSSWIKLAECLHTGSFKKRFPNTFKAVQDMRENAKIETFNSKVEARILAISRNNAIVRPTKLSNKQEILDLTSLLATRPGELTRRLDFLVANAETSVIPDIISRFEAVVDDVATTILLKFRSHIGTRDKALESRHFIPKGNCGKVKVLPGDARFAIGVGHIEMIQEVISASLKKRFSERESLGTVFIHNKLHRALVPLVQRDTIEGLCTLARGSRVSFDAESKFVRPFLYWENGTAGRVDVDLSAVAYADDWNHIGEVAYYNQRENYATHSGDFVDAPDGASEFLDINIEKAIGAGIRYIAIVVNSFSGQNFDQFPCFSGFQERQNESGKNFEATTVKNRFDLVSSTLYNVPLIVDLVGQEMIWCDLSLNGGACSNAASEESGILALSKICEGMLETNPSCADLLADHDLRFDKAYEGDEALLEKLESQGVVFDNVYGPEFATDFNKISSEFL